MGCVSLIPSNSYAFSPSRYSVPSSRNYFCTPSWEDPKLRRKQQMRSYGSNNSNNYEEGNGIFQSLKKMAKKVLPETWTQSEKERKAYLVKKERQNEISSGLQEILKDAPLPVRMLGSMVAPLFSSMASTLQEQQQKTSDLLDEARSYIVADPDAVSILGEPLVMQPPFSQSSSSSSINGKTTSQVQASFPVQGAYQQGIASMTASEAGIQRLVLQVGGRSMDINVNTIRRPPKDSGPSGSNYGERLGKNRMDKNDIIDVEFAEKKNSK